MIADALRPYPIGLLPEDLAFVEIDRCDAPVRGLEQWKIARTRRPPTVTNVVQRGVARLPDITVGVPAAAGTDKPLMVPPLPEGTYRTPVSGSTAAPVQFAPASSMRVPFNVFAPWPDRDGGVNSGP